MESGTALVSPLDEQAIQAVVKAYEACCCDAGKTWMPGTGPGMTNLNQARAPVPRMLRHTRVHARLRRATALLFGVMRC
jgi:hypothetical protein